MMYEHDTSASSARRWLEAVTFTMLSPLLGLAISRSDPFLIRADFPWLVLVPLLVGTQHGLMPALASAGLLGARAYGQAILGQGPSSDLVSWIIGCLLVGAIAGHLRDRTDRAKGIALEHMRKLAAQLQEARLPQHVVEILPVPDESQPRIQRPQPLLQHPALEAQSPTSRNVTAIGFNRRSRARR
jgi:hypothetical protein